MSLLDTLDRLDDLIDGVPTLQEQLDWHAKHPTPPEPEAVDATAAADYQRLATALAPARTAHPGLSQVEMCALADAARFPARFVDAREAASQRLSPAAYRQWVESQSIERAAAAEAHAASSIERDQRRIAERRLRSANLPPDERAALEAFLGSGR